MHMLVTSTKSQDNHQRINLVNGIYGVVYSAGSDLDTIYSYKPLIAMMQSGCWKDYHRQCGRHASLQIISFACIKIKSALMCKTCHRPSGTKKGSLPVMMMTFGLRNLYYKNTRDIKTLIQNRSKKYLSCIIICQVLKNWSTKLGEEIYQLIICALFF